MKQELETKPVFDVDTAYHPESDFLFIIGDKVVGVIRADCAACAWEKGHPLYPAARMACYIDFW